MTLERGAVILIAGPDGVGKSTLAEALAAGAAAVRPVLRVHQRAPLLPRRTHHSGPVLEPHAGRPYPAWLSALKLLYLYCDALMGWWLRLRPVVDRGGWVLLERGWWDLAVDPLRYRLRDPLGLARRLGRLLPLPDLVLVLQASPERIRARSPELDEAEIERQSRAWLEALPGTARRRVLDAAAPPEAVQQAAMGAIGELTPGSAAPSRRSPAGLVRDAAGGLTGLLMGLVLRTGWGFADQALSSFTNFLMGFIVARSVDTASFGAYALVFAIYVLALNGVRALGSMPLTIRFSATSHLAWRKATAEAGGMALAAGAAAGLICLAVSLLLVGTLHDAFLALGLMLPGLMLQDTWRFAFFARDRGGRAFVNDGVWTVLQVSLFAALLLSGRFSVGLAVLAWGGSANVAALVGIWQAGIRPRLSRASRWWRAQGDIASRFLGETLVATGGQTVQPYGITAVAGLAAVGTLGAGDLVLGPFNVINQGVTLVAIPQGARLLRLSGERLRRACVVFSAGLAAAALTWSAVVLLLPDDVGAALLRDNWAPAHSVLLPLSIALVGLGATAGATIGLRVLAAAQRSLRTRIWTTFASVIIIIGGAVVAGVHGAATCIAAVSWVGTLIWWWQFGIALREYVPPRDAADVGRVVGRAVPRSPRQPRTPGAG